ncbi:MAG: FAD-dependent oxidoreductase [Holophagales bacterium]|nr:FAD-dependent oxidoreductase [Holophagales bacterium]MXW02305.1 FAD-dependent oxidoreductase [Holophagales bacterium]MYC09703.1 FAD-dependent oxidoreductase [Holophagales bacterium]
MTPTVAPNLASATASRRQFVVGVSSLFAGKAVLASAAAAASTRRRSVVREYDVDVVVVGGGFAGVTAARDSMKNGYSTLLLEARDRLGGRTWTADFDGDQVELGGTWIHHTQPFVWAEKERYGLEIEETPGAVADTGYLIADGERIRLTEARYAETYEAWRLYHAEARWIVPRAWDILHNREAALAADRISATDHIERLELSSLQRSYLRAVIAIMANGQPETMSYLELMRWHLAGGGFLPTVEDSVARFKLKRGTRSLLQAMVADAGLEARLETPVQSIRDRGDGAVVVTGAGEEIQCRAVICCLPMNTIADVAFDPPLAPGVLEAGRQRHAGAGFKLLLKAEGDVGNVATYAIGEPIDFVMTYKQAANYTLLVAFGKDPADLDVNDGDAVQRALRAHVPRAELIGSMSHDWNGDPYSRGTWAVYRPGWVTRHYDEFQRDRGRILFGSGDHGEGWRGFIDGAIGGGIRAAQRAKSLLG